MQGEGHTHTVLVVDDEPAIARSLALLFKRRGHSVLTASSGNGALEVLDQASVDCLVLDYRLPDLRGDALYQYVIARFPRLHGRAVFLTGDITLEVRQSLEHTGCRVVAKPFELNDLMSVVDEVLARDDGSAGAAEARGAAC
jgi:CheY-like chemotaxis protein